MKCWNEIGTSFYDFIILCIHLKQVVWLFRITIHVKWTYVYISLLTDNAYVYFKLINYLFVIVTLLHVIYIQLNLLNKFSEIHVLLNMNNVISCVLWKSNSFFLGKVQCVRLLNNIYNKIFLCSYFMPVLELVAKQEIMSFFEQKALTGRLFGWRTWLQKAISFFVAAVESKQFVHSRKNNTSE